MLCGAFFRCMLCACTWHLEKKKEGTVVVEGRGIYVFVSQIMVCACSVCVGGGGLVCTGCTRTFTYYDEMP